MENFIAPGGSQPHPALMSTPNHTRLTCGACNMCCVVLEVADIKKPAGMRCWHTSVHGGCGVQAQKGVDPSLEACRTWMCVFRASQDLDDTTLNLGRPFRPDIAHVMMGPWDKEDNKRLYVHVDPKFPSAHLAEPIYSYLCGIVERGGNIIVSIGNYNFEFKS